MRASLPNLESGRLLVMIRLRGNGDWQQLQSGPVSFGVNLVLDSERGPGMRSHTCGLGAGLHDYSI